ERMMASPQFWPPAAPAEIVGSPSWTSPLFPTLVRLLQPFESNFDVLDFDSAFRVIQHAVGRPHPTPGRRLFVHHHSQESIPQRSMHVAVSQRSGKTLRAALGDTPPGTPVSATIATRSRRKPPVQPMPSPGQARFPWLLSSVGEREGVLRLPPYV